MDYESLHGPGVSNFSSSPPHRMPTVSAAHALQHLTTSPTRCISTGLPPLDLGLQNRDPQSETVDPFYGGVSRGKVTEVYGPPGVGKTALGMQIAANVLHSGEKVVWVDASHPLPALRFLHILQSIQATKSASQAPPSEPLNPTDLLEKLIHFSTPTLAHLLALFSNPSDNNPPQNTGLIIIDSFSTLMGTAFPRTAEPPAAPKKAGAPKPQNPSTRKFPILQNLLNTLQKIAATRNIAVIILSQCVTKMRPGIGAILAPAIGITAWEQALGCRVVLFRDWGWNDEDGNAVDGVRLAQILKAEGTALPEGRGWLAGFTIGENGLSVLPLPSFSVIIHRPSYPIHLAAQNNNLNPTSTPQNIPQKRKRSNEIPDSEGEDDEDYGWAEEDEEDVPVMPPQWQGSEDILIPDPAEKEEEVEEEGGDGENEDADANEVNEDGRKTYEEIADSEDELAL
ncbi:hypothetical protein HYFRA_00000724 [Hymenoscyphus fraxineus]|uniref:RecA family profile 1 domain-containing protein n=1 Tax=Hymenoscyphus fraxineus TaxID=746836 RepID=A0A9N9KQE2_9HELO|nr:hypothetical protein HYFRA_00000724 [Hymenoscyphus fraxineus]